MWDTIEAAAREGYNAGYNGRRKLSGIESYRNDPMCAAYLKAYSQGLADFLARSR